MAVAAVLTLFCRGAAFAADDIDAAIRGMERRYASAETAAGNFRQIYRAPGIRRDETGSFILKRPGLMRWEYRTPEEKLFVADGKECFLYEPRDRRVTVYPLTPARLKHTPLSFLLGGDVRNNYDVSREKAFKPSFPETILLRLTPIRHEEDYEFVVLELDADGFAIRRVAIRESGGGTSEFLLTDVVTNVKTSGNDFKFKPPKGVEVTRIQE